jgi:hypothetical protein
LRLCWECITVSSKYLFNAERVIHKHITVKNKTGHFEKYVQVLVDDILLTGIICAFHNAIPPAAYAPDISGYLGQAVKELR